MKAGVYHQLSFLTKIMYFVAVPHLVDFAKSSKATTKKNLLVLRDAIAKSVKTCGLEDLVEAARQAVRAMDSALTTAGMVARLTRDRRILWVLKSLRRHMLIE